MLVAGPRSASRAVGRLRSRGFTLIELLVTFVVVAIMLTLAAPSFISFQKNSQLRSSANALLGAVLAGRAEAMKRQLNVFIRPGTCDAPSNDWKDGWYIYVDGDWDHACNSSNPTVDILISTQPALPTGIAVTVDPAGTKVPPDAISPYLLISGAGFLVDVNGTLVASQGLTFSNGTDIRELIIDGSGRSRVCNPGTPTAPGDPGCSPNVL